ncbi:MAG: hypothetical protein SFX18_00040 [Pirellulales bacterium]|nr:hypothetical protein [Pirellulales bacterium]
MTFPVTETFPFGDIAMSCVSSPFLDNALVVQQVAFTPNPPAGMAVDLVAAYRDSFCVPFPIHAFSFELTLTQCVTKGGPNSGESLDAQSWSIGDGLLMIGTEDGEALKNRMPWLKIEGDNYPIEYLRHGLRIAIPYVAPNTTVGFHFVLAYNQVDLGTYSEWFAVDVPYHQLLEAPVVKFIAGAMKG